jgi:hypothetical protein
MPQFQTSADLYLLNIASSIVKRYTPILGLETQCSPKLKEGVRLDLEGVGPEGGSNDASDLAVRERKPSTNRGRDKARLVL